jgi:hypothetical protein
MGNILYRVSIHPKQPTADTITFYVKSATLPTESSNGKYSPIDIVFDDSSESYSPLIKLLKRNYQFKRFRFDMTIYLLDSDYKAISCYELYDCYLDTILESSLDYTQSGTEITMRSKYNRYKFFDLV